MPRILLQKQVASAMADNWLDTDWEATPSGNITVIRTTIKLNQCQGHFLQKQVASVGADGWLDADWEDTPSGNITAITTAMKLN
jgi:hypothetical protein